MTAYDIVHYWASGPNIPEKHFYRLVTLFQYWYLHDRSYWQRVRKHRNPVIVTNEVINDLYKDLLAIQNRQEMRDDSKHGTLGYINVSVQQLWGSDKELNTLYKTIAEFCGVAKKDFNTVAIHIAEYRGMQACLRKLKKNLSVKQFHEEQFLYRFEHWENNHLSADPLHLVTEDLISYKELQKITQAQNSAYDYIISQTIKEKESALKSKVDAQNKIESIIEKEKEKLSLYFTSDSILYKGVLDYRSKYNFNLGASLIDPVTYKMVLDKKSNITLSGNKYLNMDIALFWLHKLQFISDQKFFNTRINAESFDSLISMFPERKDFARLYETGLKIAPDRSVYIKKQLESYEMTRLNSSSTLHYWNERMTKTISFEVKQYRKIGYEWVSRGYAATTDDFRTITINNTSTFGIHEESRFSIYNQILHELAVGGAIAYHVAFLRQQLSENPQASQKTQPAFEYWKGTAGQRDRLVDSLVKARFIDDTQLNRKTLFLNGVVKWLASARLLFYMVQELKSDKYSLMDRDQAFAPLVTRNFTDRHGKKFKNINQNKGGMVYAKSGKPNNYEMIDTILQSLG